MLFNTPSICVYLEIDNLLFVLHQNGLNQYLVYTTWNLILFSKLYWSYTIY